MFRYLSTKLRGFAKDGDAYRRQVSNSNRIADTRKPVQKGDKELDQLRRRFGFYL